MIEVGNRPLRRKANLAKHVNGFVSWKAYVLNLNKMSTTKQMWLLSYLFLWYVYRLLKMATTTKVQWVRFILEDIAHRLTTYII